MSLFIAGHLPSIPGNHCWSPPVLWISITTPRVHYKAQPSSDVPVENLLLEAEKATPVKPLEVLEEKSNAGEQEKKAVLKEEDEKPQVSTKEGLEDKNVPEGSRAEILGGKVDDVAIVAESKAEEQRVGDLAEKTTKKDQEEEKQSAENLKENVDHDADAKPAEEEKKDDAGNEEEVPDANVVDAYSELQNSMSMSERRKRKKLEVFVGGLDKEATEDDLRLVFEKVGEITELRLMKDLQTGKNKGYAFVRYATLDEAKRAVKELARTEVC
jgi:TATA-binding protein-associated factor Taf7